MRLPHRVFSRSPLPAVVGRWVIGRPFAALTVFCFICVPGTQISQQVLAHETRHVLQFYVGWLAGLALFAVLQPTWWAWGLTPLTFTVAYLVAGAVSVLRGGTFYRDNWFEVDARRAAGEPE